jgi:hypothetical protein
VPEGEEGGLGGESNTWTMQGLVEPEKDFDFIPSAMGNIEGH